MTGPSLFFHRPCCPLPLFFPLLLLYDLLAKVVRWQMSVTFSPFQNGSCSRTLKQQHVPPLNSTVPSAASPVEQMNRANGEKYLSARPPVCLGPGRQKSTLNVQARAKPRLSLSICTICSFLSSAAAGPLARVKLHCSALHWCAPFATAAKVVVGARTTTAAAEGAVPSREEGKKVDHGTRYQRSEQRRRPRAAGFLSFFRSPERCFLPVLCAVR